MTINNNIKERLGVVESEVDSIKESVAELAIVVKEGFSTLAEKQRTDWKSIFAGMSIFFIVIFGVISFLGSGYIRDLNRIEGNQRLVIQTQIRMGNNVAKNSTSLELELKELHRRLDFAESWEKDHDKRVVGLNAAQWERIRAIERKVFGQPVDLFGSK